jgi:hypothetical protein
MNQVMQLDSQAAVTAVAAVVSTSCNLPLGWLGLTCQVRMQPTQVKLDLVCNHSAAGTSTTTKH